MKKHFGYALVAGIAIAGCTSQPSGPQLKLQQQYPDAAVVGLGQVPITSEQSRFESKLISQKSSSELTYPLRALNQGRGIQGCVVIELLLDTDGTVKRTEVAEAYPRGYFNQASLREARRFRYPSSGQQTITYHHFVYKIDQSRDTGLEEIVRAPGYTELLHLNRIPTDPTIPAGFTGYTSRINDTLPKRCEGIAERYLQPTLPKQP